MSLASLLLGGGATYPPLAPPLTVFGVTSAPEGGNCWFQDVRAVYLPSVGDVVFGYVDNAGHVRVRTIDDTTLSVSSAVTLATIEADDHDNPVFLRRASDGKLITFYTTHVGNVYRSTSSSADDITTLPSGSDITTEFGGRAGSNGFTYSHLFQLTGEAGSPSPIYFSVRYHGTGGEPYIAAARSYDDGANWESIGSLANNISLLAQITYHKAALNGDDRIDFAASNHPDDSGGEYGDHGIYHFYYQGDNLYQTDGTLIGAVESGGNPGGSYDITELTQVDDASGGICWIWDIAIDPDTGYPIIVYVVYEATYPTGRWHYEYARWTGSAWEHFELADAGGKFATTTDLAFGRQYAGGVVLDHQRPDIAYFSSNHGTSFHEIYRAIVRGSIVTVDAITEGSTENQIRPHPVYGSNSIKVLWNAGSYDDYFGNYSLGTRGAYA